MNRVAQLVVLALIGGLFLAGAPSAVRAAETPAGRLVSDDPANFTPHVIDGRVYSIVQVGDTMILGGQFTQTRNNSSQTVIPRTNVVAFNATTGVITPFAPNPNGTVNVVLPTGDGETVWVGGTFTTIGGVARKNLAKVRVSDGTVVTQFNAGNIAGQVKDLRLVGGHLWVAGGFTHIANRRQPALATVNPTTGAFDTFFTGAVEGVHREGGYTTGMKLDADPDGTRMAVVGNFDTLNGVKNHQMFLLDLTGSTAVQANFQTAFYEAGCSSAFDSYMRDVDFSPDGKFFVVSTTGAYGGSDQPCDTTARWDVSKSGNGVTPSWVNYTGGDTTYAVEITDSAVYTGGHARWQNNPFAGDNAGPGAVGRPGIAALSPDSGIPFSWNPTRTRGVGVFDFLATAQGLWLGSDTDRVGQAYEYHGKIALMPAAGAQFPAVKAPAVPNDLYLGGPTGVNSDPSVLYRVNAAGPELQASKGIDWAADLNESPSPYLTTSGNRSGYSTVGSVSPTVPAGTPVDIFSNELWDGGGGDEMQWSFPVPTGTPIEVRLYFANRYDGTSQVGQRVFDVALDDSTVLDDYDIAADVGHNVGTMKKFDISSDGSVDISLGHVVENPLINGIEIIRTDLPPAASGGVLKRSFSGSAAGPNIAVPDGGLDWDTVRGGFMINGYLYLATSDGSFSRRTFNGTAYGTPQAVNAQDELTVLQDWKSDISAATSMFFDFGRIYFTRSGSSTLYYRYFNPESGVVGAKRLVASENVEGLNLSTVRGMVATSSKIFFASSNGNLYQMDWSNADPTSGKPVAGTAELVSGPGAGGPAWGSKALFLFQSTNGGAAPQPPVASFTTDCEGYTCEFDASASSAPGSSVSGYAWDFGDGDTDSGKTASHEFEPGSHQVTLTVTAASGAESSSSTTVTISRVNQRPVADFSVSCELLECTFDGSSSEDPDGSISSYAWEVNGAAEGDEPTIEHTFDSAGAKEVTLEVTDNDGATHSVTKTVTVTEEAAATVDFVGAASSNGNRSTHSVTIPTSVQAGDRILLFMTTNSSTSTINPPVGWESVRSVEASGLRGQTWTRVATAADAGRVVAVTTTAIAKADLSVAAYRSSEGTPRIDAEGGRTVAGSTALTSPVVAADADDFWLVSYWGIKSSAAVELDIPGSSALRSSSTGTGSGRVDAFLADSGAPLSSAEAGGIEATLGVAATRAAIFSIVLSGE